MTPLDTTVCYRTTSTSLGKALRLFPYVAAFARRFAPTGIAGLYAATRYDDVIEVFATDSAFAAPYAENLAIITGGEPFFLAMADTAEYRTQLAAMRAVVLPQDLPRLADEAEARAAALIAASGGKIDVVELVRRATFDVIAAYFGIPEPPDGRLDVWSCRLFEFQFTGSLSDTAWVADARQFAQAFQAHVDRTIAARKQSGTGPDDVLGRCLARQASGEPGYDDVAIRTALMCMVVGGPPQPPMVAPNAVEQLLRRPVWLAEAQRAAREGKDGRLHDIVFEAMRFDPLAPALRRMATRDYVLAQGTPRARHVPRGTTVLASFASAMLDPRRIPDPTRFDPGRQPHEYIHFGHGLHQCFGEAINHATLHRMLKPLLAQPRLQRSSGSSGRLSKVGAFANRLVVSFG